MGSKSKKILKVWVFALSMIFAMALALGITGAAYNTARDADGTLTLNQGIVIDYTGFGKAENGVWESETTTTFKLFADSSIAPGATINLNAAGIKKGTNSIDYFVRIKFDYKFYDANNVDVTTTVGNGYSAFISTPSFASAWVDGNNNDGWFYYATGTTLNALPSADYVSIFPSNSAINVELNAEGFNHAGGGYKFSNEVTIAKVEAILTLQALQTTGATWEIIPAVIENSSSQVIQINSNEITLGNVGGVYKLGTGEAGSLAYNTANLGTTLKIVVEGDSQINANAFDGSNIENIYIGDADYIAGVSSYSAKIYSTPATFIIGANAFKGCSNLNIYLTSNINYLIYKSAISEVSHIYYDGNDITSIIKNSSDGYVYNTITMTVSTVIPGGNVSSNSGASASSGL
ncbi:MAG: hypothetical protein J5779_00130, partial [Clostridia bacterium]|nr:hypothetical protein [Clostridia bacterium]